MTYSTSNSNFLTLSLKPSTPSSNLNCRYYLSSTSASYWTWTNYWVNYVCSYSLVSLSLSSVLLVLCNSYWTSVRSYSLVLSSDSNLSISWFCVVSVCIWLRLSSAMWFRSALSLTWLVSSTSKSHALRSRCCSVLLNSYSYDACNSITVPSSDYTLYSLSSNSLLASYPSWISLSLPAMLTLSLSIYVSL